MVRAGFGLGRRAGGRNKLGVLPPCVRAPQLERQQAWGQSRLCHLPACDSGSSHLWACFPRVSGRRHRYPPRGSALHEVVHVKRSLVYSVRP